MWCLEISSYLLNTFLCFPPQQSVYRSMKMTRTIVSKASHFNPMPAVSRVPKASRFFNTNGGVSGENFRSVTSALARDENGVRLPTPSGFGSLGFQIPYERDVRPMTSSAEGHSQVPEKAETSEDPAERKSEPERKPLYQRSPASNFRLLVPEIRRPMTRSRY